ncbi:hypothetical protein QH494_04675 [Sphingomonas sp. AR_OL41]|uniref:alpha-glutamyl/putrescinyl thymine pyrophosphorylase clade 3 protein n=1 Tax=Sphingomonas sp. AR_OL41 TaxID=3042729 RepID=UPI00248110FA|nr:hypothetical protein [Sphingomonas sp. AR_OL41]MDH7971467.1 hypothetical protein [Sphingomonas sp. AR_OL41]
MINRIKDRDKFDRFVALIEEIPSEIPARLGFNSENRKRVFAAQLVDSVRRIEYLNVHSANSRSSNLHTPYSGSFEPFGGASVMLRAGHEDDAYWLIYLATHFGKHKVDGWNLTEDFYGRFNQGGVWDWAAASQNPTAIAQWLGSIYPALTRTGRSRRFGNHRKFETLKPGPKGTGAAVASYINWVNEYGSHRALIGEAQKQVGQNPEEVFSFLYKDLRKVSKLGRLGKFDFLCNLSNLLIAPIFPDKAYIAGSTGPLAGAKMLFGVLSVKALEDACAQLSHHFNVSPQAIEDTLCNWQKSPSKYIYFRG